MKLEDIRVGAELKGLRANEVVEVIQVRPVGIDAVSVHYKGSDGRTEEQMLFRSHEDVLEAAATGRSWAFDASGDDFKLGLEAYRISQAALFDPCLPSTPRRSIPYPTRSPQSTRRCCPSSRFDMCWLTTRVREKPSWQGFSSPSC